MAHILDLVIRKNCVCLANICFSSIWSVEEREMGWEDVKIIWDYNAIYQMPEWAFESPSDRSGLLSHFLWQVVLASLSPSSKLLMLCIRFPKSRAEATNLGDWLAFACAVPFMINAPSNFLHQSPIHSPDVTSCIQVCMSSLICSSHCVLLLGNIFKVFGHSPLPPVSFHCILILIVSIYHFWNL